MKKQKFSKIYIQDWIILKPYDKQVVTDSYYLKLANKVKELFIREFADEDNTIDDFFDSDDELTLLSCFLTSYFEDIISETNIWNTFIRKHKELYQKELPFFKISENYIHECINHQDISFLLWYFMNTLRDNEVIHHFNLFFQLMPIRIMKIFDAEYETAPENEHLKNYYQLNPNETDLYAVRDVIRNILFNTYLFHPDTFLTFDEEALQIVEEAKNEKRSEEKTLMFLRETELAVFNSKHTKLLNMKGKEWLAALLGEQHPLYHDILNCSERIFGLFFYKGENEKDVFIEHIASAMPFKLTKKSLDFPFPAHHVDDIVYIGIQQWQNEWWFSGNIVPMPFDADLILDEKNSLASRKAVNFITHAQNEAKIKSILADQEKAFLELNNNSPIVFLPKEDIEKYNSNFMEYYNQSLNLSKKEQEAALQRARKEGYFGSNEPYSESYKATLTSEEVESALLFFNPNGGLEIAFGINSAFPTHTNPFYKENECINSTFALLFDDTFSTELALYCVDNFKDESIFFDEFGDNYLADLDFTLRFFKGDNYLTKPQITLTGINHLKAV